jgi:hypothetical protein
MPASTPTPVRNVAGLVVGVFVLLALTAVAAAETPDELREQRREVQEEAADLATDVNALTDDAELVADALAALEAGVDAQEAALDAAERGVLQAEAARDTAERAVADLEARQAQLEIDLRLAAVEAFVGFQAPAGGVDQLGDDPVRFAREEALVEFATGSRVDAIDEMRAVGAELEDQRRLAEQAEADADSFRSQVADRLAELADARDRQSAILIEVEDRLDARLAEVAALEALDAELAAEIRAEEQKIADEIAARVRNNTNNTVTVPNNAPVDLTTVRGIVVNVAIATQTEGLLAAMAAEGFAMGGGGYRSSDAQISLRRAHCGTSDYAIWEMSASQCRPPTARPGRSAHERGLAIDFTYNGSAIRSRSSAVFLAMQRIAPQFGFINLPSEPWHWSVTGT